MRKAHVIADGLRQACTHPLTPIFRQLLILSILSAIPPLSMALVAFGMAIARCPHGPQARAGLWVPTTYSIQGIAMRALFFSSTAPKRFLTSALVLCGMFVAVSPASAAVIVYYSLTGDTNDGDPVPYTTVAPGVTATDLTKDSNLQNFQAGVVKNGINGLDVSPMAGTMPTSVEDAFGKIDTFSFTVTPPSGYSLNVTDITFDIVAGGSSGTRQTGIRTSLTGGTTLYTSPVLTTTAMFGVSAPIGTNPALQNITGPVTFTFAVYTPNGNSTIQFGNITLNGTLQEVPEPASLAVWMTLSVIGGAGWRWRKRKVSA